MDELFAEWHLERLHRRALARRHRDEAVEVARRAACGVEVDRVTAAEQPGHDRLGDTRRERGSDERAVDKRGPRTADDVEPLEPAEG